MNPVILYAVGIGFFDLIGTLSAKLWSINKNPLFLLGTFLFFGTAGFLFARSLQYIGMAIMNIFWIVISVILITFFGYFLFKENVTLIQFIGIAIALIGVVLINLK